MINKGINHIFTLDDNLKKDFKNDSYALRQAHSLCSSITTEEEQREAAFIEAIRISINRINETEKKISKNEINNQINELLHHSIQSDGVINLFQDFEKGFSLFDPNFLDKISKLEQKNLSIELLSKIITDEISSISKSDIVKSEEFSEKLKRIMKQYKSGLLDNAQAFDRFTGISEMVDEVDVHYGSDKIDEIRQLLIELAKETVESEKEHEKLGITKAEMAFYNAIAKKENIQDFYTNEQLVSITKELTKRLNEEMTQDWPVRESTRANIRNVIRRLLLEYKYPGNNSEVIELVVKQAERMYNTRGFDDERLA